MPGLDPHLAADLERLTALGRRRHLPPIGGSNRQAITCGERAFVSFCSNDYLGLAGDPRLAEAAAAGAGAHGTGAGASRLVAGDLPEHRALESALAALVQLPAVLVFPTGYQANLAAIGALAGREDLVASDALNHASLVDGCRLARARVVVYPHASVSGAAAALATAGSFRRRFLVTESLFSMDGDAAPLAALAAAARAADAFLLVDEAHALGAVGPQGRGLAAALGVVPDALVGTLGKSFGVQGGFIAGSALLREVLLNTARTFVFTTALAPPLAAAALAAVEIALSPEGNERRRHLLERAGSLRARLRATSRPAPGDGAILPVVLGPETAALAAAANLQTAGLFVQAIRPPTVPPGTSRLRITLSAAHTEDDVGRLADALLALPAAAPLAAAPTF